MLSRHFFRHKHIEYQHGENNEVRNMGENLQQTHETNKTKRVAACKGIGGNLIKRP
jgi:hypothetical protein